MITIRRATHTDVETLTELSFVMHQESQFKQYNFNADKVRRMWTSYIELPAMGIALAAELDGKLVGAFLGGVVEHFFGDDRQAYDLGLFVHPEHRNSKVGALLLLEYIKQAKEMGVDEIMIANSTGVDPERVAMLFERAGFTKYGYVYRMNVEKGKCV